MDTSLPPFLLPIIITAPQAPVATSRLHLTRPVIQFNRKTLSRPVTVCTASPSCAHSLRNQFVPWVKITTVIIFFLLNFTIIKASTSDVRLGFSIFTQRKCSSSVLKGNLKKAARVELISKSMDRANPKNFNYAIQQYIYIYTHTHTHTHTHTYIFPWPLVLTVSYCMNAVKTVSRSWSIFRLTSYEQRCIKKVTYGEMWVCTNV